MKENSEAIDRRNFLKSTAATIAGVAATNNLSAVSSDGQIGAFKLEEATIADIQAKFRSGEFTSSRLVEMYRARIVALDGNLRSIIELNPDAQEIAARADAVRALGKTTSPLHGIPVLIKDNIDTGDKMLTTAGSLAMLDNRAKQDSFLTKKLRDAGAIILGKTNLSEWANFRSTKSSSGWSGRGGQTKNPYALERNPCGSSSGTGASIAANFATVGIGTETDGSIVCPSNACGLVGIKPTVGLVSRSGIIPISHTQDTAGPMTRTVTDAAILLGAIAGTDANDSATRGAKIPAGGYEQFLKTDLTGKRIGIAKQFFGKNAAVDKIIETTFPLLEKSGAKLVDIKMSTAAKLDKDEYEVLLYEFKADLNKYLSTAATRYKTLAQLIEFNNQNAEKEMPHFGQEIFLAAEKKGPLTERKYLLSLKKCQLLSRAQGIDLVMNENKLDAILAPTGGPAWMTDLVNGDCGSAYIGSSTIAAVAGYPAITVPVGFIGGLPFGVSFFGRAWSEGLLINIGYSFEQETKARRAPKIG